MMKIPNFGLVFATIVMSLWAALLLYALFKHTLCLWTTPFLWLAIHHLYTGLFITAHDSIHGTVCSDPALNRWIGKFCVLVFAGFDYDVLRDDHWKHHSHAGLEGEDPDFHRGNPQFLAWFFGFMMQYMSLLQVSRLLCLISILWLLGAPLLHLFLFNAVGGISSAVMLFYFGTYLPHMPDEGATSLDRPDNFRTLDKDDSRLTSFLKSYNFGCHSEHHANPRVPWWALYDAHLAMIEK
jgi:beta-carotene ketolase (CrtW type)